MRAAAGLATMFLVALGGCARVLGLEDPSSHADAGDDAGSDSGSDGGSNTGDHLVFSLGDFKLAQQQIVRVHVQLVHAGGATEDVTDTASYTSDNLGFAMVDRGQITGAAPGTATITARLGDATPATLHATVKATICHPVINEFATGGTTGADEWVEIYNPCAGMIDVTGWTLNYRAATAGSSVPDDTDLMVTLAGSMAAGELRLYAGAGTDYAGIRDDHWDNPSGIMKFDVGAIGLRVGPLRTDAIKDAVAYGTIPDPNHPFIKGHPAPRMDVGRSSSRLPFDGKDEEDGGLDFKVSSTARTPRSLNVP